METDFIVLPREAYPFYIRGMVDKHKSEIREALFQIFENNPQAKGWRGSKGTDDGGHHIVYKDGITLSVKIDVVCAPTITD